MANVTFSIQNSFEDDIYYNISEGVPCPQFLLKLDSFPNQHKLKFFAIIVYKVTFEHHPPPPSKNIVSEPKEERKAKKEWQAGD